MTSDETERTERLQFMLSMDELASVDERTACLIGRPPFGSYSGAGLAAAKNCVRSGKVAPRRRTPA
jgi:hypothetical protein